MLSIEPNHTHPGHRYTYFLAKKTHFPMQAHNFFSSFAIENYKREVFRQKYYSDYNFLHHCTPVRRHPSQLLELEVMLATCSIMWSKNTFPYLRLNFWGYGVFEHSLQNYTSYKPTFKQGKKVCRVTVVRCYDNLFFLPAQKGQHSKQVSTNEDKETQLQWSVVNCAGLQ